MAEPSFLLDSNICIDLLGGRSAAARTRVQSVRRGGIAISAIAFAEVMIGIRKLDAAVEAEAFFRLIPVLPFDEHAAYVCSRLPFRRGSYDRLIAAHALALGLTLVTNNERDFADLPGLKVENWASDAP